MVEIILIPIMGMATIKLVMKGRTKMESIVKIIKAVEGMAMGEEDTIDTRAQIMPLMVTTLLISQRNLLLLAKHHSKPHKETA